MRPGSLFHKFSHAMDDIPVWEALGTSYGFSSIGIPITHPGLDPFNKAISDWVDERIQSKPNMTALAEHGVDMDHPCVRVYTKEEVDANRTFLAASAESFTVREFFKVCLFGFSYHHPSSNFLPKKASPEKIQSGEVKLRVVGGRVSSPESVFELLRKRKLDVDKQRDELKPQWLRDWQDSQRRGQSESS